ncbi:insulinase family protein [Ectothiorhodospiraceae bacterium 2226]|nr:insulinase family protein [Ectothiorhodospiraceae bacterium 2226]
MSKESAQTLRRAPQAAATQAHPAFEFVRAERIESLNLAVEEYRHRNTGAVHYHLAADNDENVFLVALRTMPQDSTGVAHILEHTVLCGSERYPVRDPFFMMIRRSLNTFMNAFTSSDWTAYPFASKNRKDFNNLLDVYLDAVFFSRLHELDFAQEGHRLEFEQPDDPTTPLVYRGVVYNEMKGAMSSPASVLWHTFTKYLFPTTTYHYNSGGEPDHIPDLSYAALKAFYRTHYHPSNAVFMTYGDIPAAEHQAHFEERALHRFERLETHLAVPDEKRYYAPVNVEESYPAEDGAEGDKTHIVLGWLLGPSTDLEEMLKAHLLSSVLLDNSASPLRRALETTELGRAPSPLCGVEDSNREMSLMCGLEGSRPERAEALEQLVLEVLREVAEHGVPQDRLDAALHQLELSQREITGGSYPYGLHLILTGLSAGIHRGDPVAVLNLDPVLERLREQVREPDFVQRLVRERLLDNPHRVRLTLKPDAEMGTRAEQAVAQRLAARKARLSEAERAFVVNRAQELKARQEQHDDPGVLPKVGLEDVPPELAIPEGRVVGEKPVPLTFYGQGTNGLVYQDLVIELPELEDDLLEVLTHYTASLTEVGSGGRDYLETQSLHFAVTGGLGARATVRGAVDDEQRVKGYFVLSGKALARNADALSDLMRETLEQVRFDEHRRIRELMAQRREARERSITGNGHALAMKAAASGMSPTAAFAHRVRGLEGIRALRALDAELDAEGGVARLVERFERLHERVLAAPRQFLLVGEAERGEALAQGLAARWADAPAGAVAFQALALPGVRNPVRQFWSTSTQVNFCAKAYPTVPMEHPDAAALAVLGVFLRNGFLHRAIREQGGAYGGGAGQDSDSAAFRFFSYRDPRLEETLADFDRSIEWLLSARHEPRALEEAVLGVIGSFDKPGSPAGEAKQAFHNKLYGRTSERLQQFRKRILAVSLDDLRRVGETYLRPEQASVAVVSNAGCLERAAALELEVCKL